MAKGGVNNFRREHGYEGAKTMEMKCSNDMPRQLCEIHAERNMRVLERSFQGMQMSLGPGDSVEETNKFVRDGVFTEQGDLFDCMEDDRGFEDGSVERVNSM